jgi:hypothetical protein
LNWDEVEGWGTEGDEASSSNWRLGDSEEVAATWNVAHRPGFEEELMPVLPGEERKGKESQRTIWGDEKAGCPPNCLLERRREEFRVQTGSERFLVAGS